MWGTYILECFRPEEARAVRDALDSLLGPESGSAWSSGGVYVFWSPTTREPLYVGITGDFPVRFAQHAGLRAYPADKCRREQIRAYFEENKTLGYTILPMSSLDQISTERHRDFLPLEDEDLSEFREELSEVAYDECRKLEGELLASYANSPGGLPPWNKAPGRIPEVVPRGDKTLEAAVGRLDLLLQARRSLRELEADGAATLFEEQLHAVRFQAVHEAARNGVGFRNDLVRSRLPGSLIMPELRDAMLQSGYLDQRCPLTVGPLLDP